MTGLEGTSAVVYGLHPTRGYPVTFHITPMTSRRPALFLVESADGRLADDDAWRWAAKDAQVLSAEQAATLVSRVARHA